MESAMKEDQILMYLFTHDTNWQIAKLCEWEHILKTIMKTKKHPYLGNQHVSWQENNKKYDNVSLMDEQIDGWVSVYGFEVSFVLRDHFQSLLFY